jgi:hypothetical protein
MFMTRRITRGGLVFKPRIVARLARPPLLCDYWFMNVIIPNPNIVRSK